MTSLDNLTAQVNKNNADIDAVLASPSRAPPLRHSSML